MLEDGAGTDLGHLAGAPRRNRPPQFGIPVMKSSDHTTCRALACCHSALPSSSVTVGGPGFPVQVIRAGVQLEGVVPEVGTLPEMGTPDLQSGEWKGRWEEPFGESRGD